MNTLEQQAAEYAKRYPAEMREAIAQAWLAGRRSKTKKAELDLSFVDDQYMDLFLYWLNYKKERKQSYTQSGAETCYHRLLKISGGVKQVMLDALEFSISNNYQGIYLPKNYDARNNQTVQRNPNIFDAADSVLQGG